MQNDLVITTQDNLSTLIAQGVKETLLELLPQLQKTTEAETYLTREQTAEYLSVSLQTLHNWTNKGRLKAYKICGRVYYKRTDLENSFIQFNPKNT